MTNWHLEKEFIAPEMSGLPGRGRITGPIAQITKIMDAVMDGRLDRIEELEDYIRRLEREVVEYAEHSAIMGGRPREVAHEEALAILGKIRRG